MSSSADKNKLHKAGGFHIEKIEVITSKGVVVDLLGILVHITFFEDIQTTQFEVRINKLLLLEKDLNIH